MPDDRRRLHHEAVMATLKPVHAKALRLDESRTAAAFRAGECTRRISPTRRKAREAGAAELEAASAGHSRREIASWFGNASDRVGSEICTGKVPVTIGEVALLAPLRVAERTLLATLRTRYERELATEDLPEPLRALYRARLATIDLLLASPSAA
jgi:hypothetical protein